MTDKQKDELLTLIEHVRRDISYGQEGTFGDGNRFFEKEAGKVNRGIETLKKILLRA